MQSGTRWLAGTAVAGALLLAASVSTSAGAQAAPAPGEGFCPGADAMVTAGRLTQEQADAMHQRMRSYMATQPGGANHPGPAMMGGRGMMGE